MIPALTLATLSVLGCGAAFGQAAAASAPAFEVASVKRNTTGERDSGDAKGDRLTLRNMPMTVLIALAYQVPNDRVVGPAWLITDGFDIDAKLPPGATRETVWPMMQNLLAERFKLAVHRDQTPVPVYALVVGKSGPKLQEASAESRALERVRDMCSREDMKMTCQSRKSTMADLVRNLPRWMSHDWFDLPIMDQTGLAGSYDFTLTFTMTRNIDDPAGGSLLDAIQDQLGLRLERRKAPLERIVIDRIERIPTDN